MKLTDHFKIHPVWYDELLPYGPDELLSKMAFVFMMKMDDRLYFRLKEPKQDPYNIGMDCFQFSFDNENGIWINDGDMRFNHFMGERIIDSGADIIDFIKQYLTERGLSNLIKMNLSKDLKY